MRTAATLTLAVAAAFSARWRTACKQRSACISMDAASSLREGQEVPQCIPPPNVTEHDAGPRHRFEATPLDTHFGDDSGPLRGHLASIPPRAQEVGRHILKLLAGIFELICLVFFTVKDVHANAIVVAHDINTLGTFVAGAQEEMFAVNVATFLTQGISTKNLLLFESNPGDGTRDFSVGVLNALATAGFSVTVTPDYTTPFAAFDTIFVAEDYPSIGFLDNMALIEYVNSGGSVYLAGGVGDVASTEAAGWSLFLNNFGLAFDSSGYNGLTSVTITSGHPIFTGITALGCGNGQDIIDLGTNPNAQIVQSVGAEGVYAVVTGVSTSTTTTTTSTTSTSTSTSSTTSTTTTTTSSTTSTTRAPTTTTTSTTSTTTTAPPTTTTIPGNLPPDCSNAAASPAMLWPPNHQFVDVSVVGVTDPDGDPIAVIITGITQDEPLNGGGSGNTCPDATGVGTATASLRAEREGTGDGRVYHIAFTADDGRGGRCTGTVTVCVPHDQGAGRVCVDQGPLVDSTGPTCVGACTGACAIEMAVAQPVCTGENLPALLVQRLNSAQQLIAQAAGTSGKKKAKRLMRKGIKALKPAVGIAAKAAKKGTISSLCAKAVATEFSNAQQSADRWLHTR